MKVISTPTRSLNNQSAALIQQQNLLTQQESDQLPKNEVLPKIVWCILEPHQLGVTLYHPSTAQTDSNICHTHSERPPAQKDIHLLCS